MKTVLDHLRAGLHLPAEPMPSPAELRRTEWCEAFEEAMRARLVMGAFRYGRMMQEGKPNFDRITSIIGRIRQYEADGNIEHLVDIANLALLEFRIGQHPRRHWHAVDDGPHTQPKTPNPEPETRNKE